MFKQLLGRALFVAVAMLFAGLALAPSGQAQYAQHRYDAQTWQDWDWDGNYQRLVRINAGTLITVRTTQTIRSTRSDGRIFPAVVDEDVWDDYRRLIVPAIPGGSRADLVVRTARDGDLILDLDAIYAHGYRYTLDVVPERVEGEGRWEREGGDMAAYLGGGAVLGAIIGAMAGGGKGAGIGAAAGAAAGLGLAYRGNDIRIPAGSRLTFQLQRPLTMRAFRDTPRPRNYPRLP